MCASFYVGVCVQWVKLMVAAVGALLPPRAQSELSSSSLCIKWQTTLCSCPLKRRAQLEWKMWHFIIIYVYVSARGSASLWKASFENKPGLLLSPLPRGNWWRYPTMPEPISSCWLVEGGGGGGASASLLSTKQASLAGAADAKHSSIPQPLWSTVREQGEAEHCCFPPSSFWISGCSCDLFKRATNFNTTHTLQNTHNVRV